MLSKNIFFKNELKLKKKIKLTKIIKKKFLKLRQDYLTNKIPLLKTYEKSYYIKKNNTFLNKIKKNNSFNIVGMGGSILGSKSIYSFLKHKIKKNFIFFDNLKEQSFNFNNKKQQNNIIISKSGNTLETIVNLNLILKNNKDNSNIFITELKDSNLFKVANKLKAEIIEHKNFIGGRYSVMSEAGMIPAYLMGLKIDNFKNLNKLIFNKKFIDSLISDVFFIHKLLIKKKNNAIILNFDPDMHDFCLWYQQLISESLGKKGKGFLPIVSTLPKDHHSLLQYHLDGPKNSFFTIFSSKHKKSYKLKNSSLLNQKKYLLKRSLEEVMNAQRFATENTFLEKKIPFRAFHIFKKSEEELGILFTFFVLETIFLSRIIGVNPFNQPEVEQLKKKTKTNLLTN